MTKPTKEQLLRLQEHTSDEIRALPIGPARVSDQARWLQAAWQCTGVALGKRRAQPGSTRADAVALCARIIAGETVPIDDLRRVTMPAGEREHLRREHHATKKSPAQLDREIAIATARTAEQKLATIARTRRPTEAETQEALKAYATAAKAVATAAKATVAATKTYAAASKTYATTAKAAAGDIEARFPIGTHVKGTRRAFAFEGVIGKVTGYDKDEVKVRLLAPVEYMGKRVQTWTFDPDAIAVVTPDQIAVDKLLQRMKTLQAQRDKASTELRDAGRESDGLSADAERGHPVTPARKKAADKRWGRAVRAEQALSNKMRDVVLKIRAIDPTRVPHGWQNTR